VKLLNLDLRVSINSGLALLIYLVAFFGVLVMMKASEAVAANAVTIMTALTGAFASFLVKRNSGRKQEAEVEIVKLKNGNGKEDPLS